MLVPSTLLPIQMWLEFIQICALSFVVLHYVENYMEISCQTWRASATIFNASPKVSIEQFCERNIKSYFFVLRPLATAI